MLRMIAKLLKVLNSETDPGQISLAVCFAMVMGLTPFYSLHNLLVLFLALVLRINLSAFILSWVIFSGVAYLLDPLFHKIGLNLLIAGFLNGIWTYLYNSTFWRLENFNNSIVMVSLLFSLVLFVPVYQISNLIIKRYREHILEWINKLWIVKIFQGTKLYSVYRSVSGLKGGL